MDKEYKELIKLNLNNSNRIHFSIQIVELDNLCNLHKELQEKLWTMEKLNTNNISKEELELLQIPNLIRINKK